MSNCNRQKLKESIGVKGTAQPEPLSVEETVCPVQGRMRCSTDSRRKDGKGRVLVGWAGEGEARETEDAYGVRVRREAGEMEGTHGIGGELRRERALMG